MEKYIFQRIQCQDYSLVLCGILVSGRLTAIFPDLNSLNFYIWSDLEHSAGKSPSNASHQSGCSVSIIATEWDWLAVDISARPAAHSFAGWRPSWGKMAPTLNRRATNSPIYNNQHISVLLTASMRDGGLYIEKKNNLVHD
jgi:hypothetical protein